MNIKLGISGSRNGMSPHQKEMFQRWLTVLDPGELHHGDCVGVDEDAHDIVWENWKGINIYIYPPENGNFRAYCQHAFWYQDPKPYLARNQDIVNASDVLLAFPSGHEESQPRSGTWATVRKARKAKIPHVVIL